jgi:RHS repeat-associated protein
VGRSGCITRFAVAFLVAATNVWAQPLSEDDQRGIRDNLRHYCDAWLKGDANAVMATLGENTVLLPSGLAPIVGDEAIRAFWWPPDGPPPKVLAMKLEIEKAEGQDGLAYAWGKGSLTFSYEQDGNDPGNPIFSFLLSATQCGYRREADGSYLKKSLPALEFEYTQPIVSEEIHEADPKSMENLPYGLDNGRYQWLDLDGEGLSGVLTEQAEGWFYKPNLSPVNGQTEQGNEPVAVRLGAIERVTETPSLAAVSGGGQQFLDLAGDGQLDLVEFEGPTPGFYERTQDEGWASFTAFTSLPVLDWNNPNLRFVDLTGDGHADILISDDEAFCWHPSLAEAGFGPPERVCKVLDEEEGPRLVFADGTQSIYLADLSGDGLTDLARIRNGEVCYWPNLGYGRFGAKVTMDNSPWFDAPDVFDQRRIRLADIDGSGVTDIMYLGGDGVSLYFNQSGNSWSPARHVNAFPAIDSLASVQTADLLGNGTACLVWSSPLPGAAENSLRYIDLMGGQKPHLLVKSVNNLGAETCLHYAPSTKFYLADKLAGRPWISRIPFPVHVVERVETYDCISRNRFVTRYAYHHGYFDGIEREFRGFGLVEQWDTEEFAALGDLSLTRDESQDEEEPASNIEEASHVPPVLTRTWFHTGVYADRDHISDFFAGLLDASDKGEYYRDPGLNDDESGQQLLQDTMLPAGLTPEEEREACRALKGAMLRQEIYSLDGTEKEAHPHVVTEQNFTIRCLQPEAVNEYGVFLRHAREAITYQYERRPEDPRIGHALTLQVDDFGNVLKSASVGYGRRQPDAALPVEDQARQARISITYTENEFTNPIDSRDVYRTPLPAETRTYELTGIRLATGAIRFSLDELLDAGAAAVPLGYEAEPSAVELEKRLIEQVRTLYRPDDLGLSRGDPTALLPLRQVESLAVSGETYKLALTPELVAYAYGGKVTDQMLEEEGRYVHSEGDRNWGVPSGRMFLSPGTHDDAATELAYAKGNSFLPRRIRDPFHREGFETESAVSYDAYNLLVVETRDALGSIVRARNDYRVLQPSLLTDPNGNRSEVAFDVLGMVVGKAVMGKETEAKGDSLTGFDTDLDEATLLAHLNNPLADPHAILQGATSRLVYDLFAYARTQSDAHPQGAVVYALARETHQSDLRSGELTKVQHSFSYSDGFGREIQKKIQAEPGPAPQRNAQGRIMVGANGQPQVTDHDISPRWVGSGWTVLNNKDKPVRQFEPYFTDTHRFEFDVRIGVSPILFYDPVQRVVATLNPDHTWQKVVFDAWRQETWDVNDTVLVANPAEDAQACNFLVRLPSDFYLPTWYGQRIDGALGAQQQSAAGKAAKHAATPAVAHLDSLGRTFVAVAHNRVARSGDSTVDEFYATHVVFDIEGNQREVIDAMGRAVIRYDYDMLSTQIHSTSMDAGERWALNDVAGQPIRAWDARGHEFRTEYDQLHRPVRQFVRGTDGVQSDLRVLNREVLFGKIEYGEGQPDDVTLNLRTRAHKSYDNAGVVTSQAFDFKGNLLRGTRQLAADYRTLSDWAGTVTLESEVFASSTAYDALNRPISLTSPNKSEIEPTYNEANLLEQVRARIRGAAEWTTFVEDIDYNAKGQRELIRYGNGVETTCDYDPLTFHLTNLRTSRDSDGDLQDLSYTYDPAGNITYIKDDAQQTIFFANTKVTPDSEYTYDAINQLIRATGREHVGQSSQVDQNDPAIQPLPHPNNGEAMRRYTEHYEYDEAGNLLAMIHQATDGGWTRSYQYAAESNRLLSTSLPGDDLGGPYSALYQYNSHGSMSSMPHLPLMAWDFAEHMRASSTQVVNNGTSETTYYVYDGAGQRVRKVTERQAAQGEIPTRMKERIYLAGFEIYRKYDAAGNTMSLERETLHLMDDQQRVALVEMRTLGDDGSPTQLARYPLGNHLSSSSLELDDEGRITSYEEYFPYGSTSYQAVDKSIKVEAKRYRYTGKERDEETGFSYHGARYLAPWLGSWVSCDPAGLIDGVNRYSYAQQHPIDSVDRTGLQSSPASIPEDPCPHGCIGPAPLAPRDSAMVQQSFIVYQHKIETGETAADVPFSDYHRATTGGPDFPRLTAPAQLTAYIYADVTNNENPTAFSNRFKSLDDMLLAAGRTAAARNANYVLNQSGPAPRPVAEQRPVAAPASAPAPRAAAAGVWQIGKSGKAPTARPGS